MKNNNDDDGGDDGGDVWIESLAIAIDSFKFTIYVIWVNLWAAFAPNLFHFVFNAIRQIPHLLLLCGVRGKIEFSLMVFSLRSYVSIYVF